MSILNQTFSDFELIIINDGSTDTTLSVLNSIKDLRIKIISRDNRGLIYSLNQAVDLSCGEYIARMDADDVAFPERLQIQKDFLDAHPEVGIVGSWAAVIDASGNKVDVLNYPPMHDLSVRLFGFMHNPFIHPSVMIRSKILKENKYNQNFKNIEDYELWSRVLQKTKSANINKELIRYRILPTSITRKNKFSMRFKGLYVRLLYIYRISISFFL